MGKEKPSGMQGVVYTSTRLLESIRDQGCCEPNPVPNFFKGGELTLSIGSLKGGYSAIEEEGKCKLKMLKPAGSRDLL